MMFLKNAKLQFFFISDCETSEKNKGLFATCGKPLVINNSSNKHLNNPNRLPLTGSTFACSY